MLLTVVHNPSAGSGRPAADALVAALRSAGHDVAYHARKQPGLEQAIGRPADAIVLAGGDGTVGKLLHLLLHRRLPVAILPLGTANNLARSLGIAGAVEEIAARWRPGRVARLDVGIARGPWGERLFVDSAGAGAISQAMQEVDRTELPPGTDELARARACIRDRVLRARPGALEIVADGEALPPDTLLAEATLISLLGPRLAVAPGADPSDGMLDLVYAREDNRAALAEWLSAESGEVAPLHARRVRSVAFRRHAGVLRVGDTFEGSAGAGSVAAAAGGALEVLVS
jgi:diacylglycerol kinase family enzyme